MVSRVRLPSPASLDSKVCALQIATSIIEVSIVVSIGLPFSPFRVVPTISDSHALPPCTMVLTTGVTHGQTDLINRRGSPHWDTHADAREVALAGQRPDRVGAYFSDARDLSAQSDREVHRGVRSPRRSEGVAEVRR